MIIPPFDLLVQNLSFYLIQVYGEKDGDGFFWGECRGRKGFVPHNIVVEVQDPKVCAQ